MHTKISWRTSALTFSPISGWAATVTFNPKAREEFERFRNRDDTLSLGVCNGCQLLALMGWVGGGEDEGSGLIPTFQCIY